MSEVEVMRHISNALTPAVMITVTAIFANGVGEKHAQLATRMRALTQELRDRGTSARRSRSIVAQLGAFRLRLHLAHAAHLLLYAGAFVLLFLVILLSLESAHGRTDAALFVLGLVCVCIALALQIAELLRADLTMAHELDDTSAAPTASAARKDPDEPQMSTT